MKFLIVERQSGGCDYTIGCGVRVKEVEAESMEALVAKLREDAVSGTDDTISGDWLRGEWCRESVTIYTITDFRPLALPLWKSQKADREREEKARRDEAKERAELERLKKKYQ